MLRKNQNQRTNRQSAIHQFFMHSLFAYALLAACYFGSVGFRQAFAPAAAQIALPAQTKEMLLGPASLPGKQHGEGQLLADGQRFLRAIERFLRELTRNKLIRFTVPGSLIEAQKCWLAANQTRVRWY